MEHNLVNRPARRANLMVLAIWQTGRSSQTENVGHGVQPRPLGDQELRCGEPSDSVTVAATGRERARRSSRQAGRRRSYARPRCPPRGPRGSRFRSAAAFPAAPAGHARARFVPFPRPRFSRRRGAVPWSVLFQPVMPFDDLDVDPLRVRTQARAASRTSFIVKLTARLILVARISGVSCDAAMTAAQLTVGEPGGGGDQWDLPLRRRDRRWR